jgi:hypothetical protein
MDVELIWSRDGFDWSRHPQRPAFLPLGPLGRGDSHMILPSPINVTRGDNSYVYYMGGDLPHDVPAPCRYMMRGTLRRDGYYSLRADSRLGTMITRPFTLRNEPIILNAVANGGSVRATLVEPFHEACKGEPEGKPVAGYSLEESDAFTGDDLSYRLSWRGSSDLSALRGRRLMLKLACTYADLFSITL